jgi:Putative addiction module component
MTVELPLDQMTVEEKLHTMETLWSDLCRGEQNIPVPQWHKDLLAERERLVREGKAHFTDWETAKKNISKMARER